MMFPIPLFPSLTHRLEVPEFEKIKEKLIEYVYNENKKNQEGVLRSNIGGWHSSSDYNRSNNLISSTLLPVLKDYFSNRQIFKSNFEMVCNSMWININKKGDSNTLHTHPGCDLSGVFWIKVPDNSGVLEFVNPNDFAEYNLLHVYSEEIKRTSRAYQSYWFPPYEGGILLFPAHLHHGVKPNTSNEDRISVSFNIRISDK